MASTSKKLDRALNTLRRRGHKVSTNPGAAIAPGGQLIIPVDGRPLTTEEIYQLVDKVETMEPFEIETHDGNIYLVITCHQCHRRSRTLKGGEQRVWHDATCAYVDCSHTWSVLLPINNGGFEPCD